MIMPYDIKQIKARIQEMMPIVVDEFAALYGEEHRETIQQRLNATNLFIYNMPQKFIPSQNPIIMDIAVFGIDESTGKCVEITKERIK